MSSNTKTVCHIIDNKNPRWHEMQQERKDHILQIFDETSSITQVNVRTGYSRKFILETLEEAERDLHPSKTHQYTCNEYGELRANRCGNWLKLSIPDILEIVKLRKEGHKYKEIHIQFSDVSIKTLQKWVKKYENGELDPYIKEYEALKKKEGSE